MVWETVTSRWFDDGRTFLGVSDGLLGGVKEIASDKGPVSERISPRKINGWGEW